MSWIRSLLLTAALSGCDGVSPVPAERAQPPLAVLTSLPVLFPEEFTLEAPEHPLLARLKQDYAVRAVDGPEQLPPGGLLLAIQPRALTAEQLVALDKWVREGGRMVLFADSGLAWESRKALGDPSRPPFTYPDTGLLQHWGLRLQDPATEGAEPRVIAGREVQTVAPGSIKRAAGNCEVDAAGFVARCRLGRGTAVVIADADLVQVGQTGGAEGDAASNADAVAGLIETLR